ncbi:hypothetical protein SNE40_003846 [Patella caerulea]|uniref:Uncharacterized protein n=1 Tax=Patella caerulea TaxID=87958 RepID=A0AAN8KJ49_PATCE
MAATSRTIVCAGGGFPDLPTPNVNEKGNYSPRLLRNHSYKLDIKKCLRKQIDATFRDDVTITQTGGGIRMVLSSGHYQEFKRVNDLYYTNLRKKNLIEFNKSEQTDKNNVSVSTTVRIWSNVSKASFSYTINFYHTTSKTLINGPNKDVFINEHLCDILNLINKERADLINEVVRESATLDNHNADTTVPDVNCHWYMMPYAHPLIEIME